MMSDIHPTAIVSPGAILGENVKIDPFAIIHGNVRIGDNTYIGSHCEMGLSTSLGDGSPLVIGRQSTIRSHSIFYESSTFGDQLTTGHRVTVREGTHAGCNLQIGTLSDIQGSCTIGDYVRMHSNVHIGKQSAIQDFVWLFPYVVLTNDPTPPSETLQGVTVQSFAVIATSSILLPGITIGQGALVAASACVSKSVDADTIVGGVPAKVIGHTSAIRLKDGSNRAAYPWTTHFHRGYPPEVINDWVNQANRLAQAQ
jgi:acetyltransferase-like isoleucine patch superfamily enzyme